MVQTPAYTRRRILVGAGGTAGLVGHAGCSALIGDGDETSTPTTATSRERKDAVVDMALRADEPTEADVVFRDLPEGEQDIVRAALEGGSYRVCADIPDAVHSFAGRFGDARFLAHRGDRYGMWIRIGDAVFVHTTTRPSSTPACG